MDSFGLGLKPGVSPDSAAILLNRTAFGYRVHVSAAIASESSQTFLVVSRFHRAIAVITIVASAVFLLCIMLLKVEERRLDAAVMRFIGVRRRTIFGALLLEAALVAGLGSIVGTGLSYLASAVTNAYYQRFFDTGLTFSRDHRRHRALQYRAVPGARPGGRRAGGLAIGPYSPPGALGPGMSDWHWSIKSLARSRCAQPRGSGIAISAAMLLDMVMLSGGIEKSFADLLTGQGVSDPDQPERNAAVRY